MIISEQKLRSVIKKSLLESFLDSKVDSLEAVEINGLKYQAYGYITQKGKKCAMIMVKKKNHQKMMDIGAILLKAGAKYTIENNGKKFGQVAHKNNKNAYYAVPVDAKGIKFSSVKLETGAASMADWAVEIGGVLGGIPFIGEPIDIAAGIVAAIKRPPDYLLAACSILFALPAIGTAIALTGKPLIKKFGKEGAETVGKEIGKAMAKSGKEIGSETIELAAKKGDELFDALLSDDTINQACSLLNESRLLEASCSISASPWREAIESTRKEFNELIEGIKKQKDDLIKKQDDVRSAKTKKLAPKAEELSKAFSKHQEVLELANNTSRLTKGSKKWYQTSREFSEFSARKSDFRMYSKEMDEIQDLSSTFEAANDVKGYLDLIRKTFNFKDERSLVSKMYNAGLKHNAENVEFIKKLIEKNEGAPEYVLDIFQKESEVLYNHTKTQFASAQYAAKSKSSAAMEVLQDSISKLDQAMKNLEKESAEKIKQLKQFQDNASKYPDSKEFQDTMFNITTDLANTYKKGARATRETYEKMAAETATLADKFMK